MLLIGSHRRINNFAGPPLLFIQWNPSQVIRGVLLAFKSCASHTLRSHTAGAVVVMPDAKAFFSKTSRNLCWLSKDWYVVYFTKRTEINDEWDQRLIYPNANPLFGRAQCVSADSERNLIPCNWEGSGFVRLRKDCITDQEELSTGDLAEVLDLNGTEEL